MKKSSVRALPALFLPVTLLCVGLLGCGRGGKTSTPAPATPVATPAALAAHSAEFRKGVEQVAEGVHVAIGYGIANSILLVGPEGCVVVDTMESMGAATEVAAAFKPLCSTGPLKALIYTHSHPDHVQGAAAFQALAAPGAPLPIYAHADVAVAMDKISSELQPVITRRSLRMYGYGLSDDERVNEGIGGHLDLDATTALSTLRPTHTFADRLDVTFGGLKLELHHAVGETEDQIFVWLPERKVLLPADNVYKAFPNLYTIRGTGYRDPKKWAASLDAMRRLGAEIMVPSHTRPVVGRDAIAGLLTDYRDAVRFVYDQSIRLMNRGASPEDLQEQVRLPAHLAASPYLQEFYGRPGWSARNVFAGNLGWFDGDAANLQPLPPRERSERMLALAGGAAGFTQQIEAAAQRGEHAWVLELTSHALRVDAGNAAAKNARLAALKALGEAEANPNARHWYLVSYHELKGDLELPARPFQPTPEMLAAMPMSTFFDGLAVNLDPVAAATVTTAVRFEFTDTNEAWTYLVRRGVSEVIVPQHAAFAPEPTLVVRVPAQVFKEMLAKLRSPALTLATQFEVTRGGKLDLVRFLKLFEAADDAAAGAGTTTAATP